MPTKTLPEQNGNSCAAHCTVIAVADMLDVSYLLSNEYAEQVLWPSIKFQRSSDPVVNQLAEKENSDPRRIVSETELRWNAVKATLKCDETQKAEALKYVPQPLQLALGALFNMLKKSGSVATITPVDGVYYNSSYLMLKGKTASGATYDGMHNILVTSQGGQIHYYNSNEKKPAWKITRDWKLLEGQNEGKISYVFTGVCVEMMRK